MQLGCCCFLCQTRDIDGEENRPFLVQIVDRDRKSIKKICNQGVGPSEKKQQVPPDDRLSSADQAVKAA